jgi:proline racemase
MSAGSPQRITAIDAHAAGGIVRLVTSGFPRLTGRTLADKGRTLDKRHRALCRALVTEPRGSEGTVLALLTEAAAPDADAGILLWHTGGFLPFAGHALIAAAALAVAEHQLVPRDRDIVRLETPLGVRPIAISRDDDRVTGGSCTAPPAFVLAGGLPAGAGRRAVPVDIAYGGEFFIVVDGESAGVRCASEHAPMMRALAADILRSIDAQTTVAHPADPSIRGATGVMFTGPAERTDAHLRAIPVYADGTIDRSPSGGGAAALCAVLHAMGLAGVEPIAIESAVGGILRARIEGAAPVGEIDGVRVRLDAATSRVGDHVLLFEPDDPLRTGFSW